MLLFLLQGILLGAACVLPGISGGVLSVLFGFYEPVMALLADPKGCYKKYLPRLLPAFMGAVLGFLVFARLLAILLVRFPSPCICIFVGTVVGMLPSLLKEASAGEKEKGALPVFFFSMAGFFLLLIFLGHCTFSLRPGFCSYLFCGFTLALSLILPGMSFSTLLMPLSLYTPFIDGISSLSPSVLFPAMLGALATLLLFPKYITALLNTHHSLLLHAILGIILASTIRTIPADTFTSLRNFLANLLFLGLGVLMTWAGEHLFSSPE